MDSSITQRFEAGRASLRPVRGAIFGIQRSILRGLAILGTASLVGAAIAPAALAASGGDSNRGDVWVDTANSSPGPGHEEDSHLPCADFNIFGSNMADNHGTFSLLLWPPSGSKQRVYSAVWTYSGSGTQRIASVSIQQLRADVAAAGGTSPNMHLRLDLAQDPSKHKMFWIDCSNTPTAAVDDDRSGPDAQDAADNAGTNDNDSAGPDAQDAADNAGTNDNDSSGPDAQDAADNTCDNDSAGADAQDAADNSPGTTDDDASGPDNEDAADNAGTNPADNDAAGPDAEDAADKAPRSNDNDANGSDAQDAADRAGSSDNDCAGPDAEDAADIAGANDNDSSGPDAQDAADVAGTNDDDSTGPDAQDVIDNNGGVLAASVTSAGTSPVALAQTGAGAGAAPATTAVPAGPAAVAAGTAGTGITMPATGRAANFLLLELPLPLLVLGTVLFRASRARERNIADAS